MMGHLCADIKLSSLHNLMKKQWLIPLNSTFFVVIEYAHERLLNLHC